MLTLSSSTPRLGRGVQTILPAAAAGWGSPGTVSLLCNANEGFVVDRIGNALGIEFEDAAEEAYG